MTNINAFETFVTVSGAVIPDPHFQPRHAPFLMDLPLTSVAPKNFPVSKRFLFSVR
jgi:hypothetical protein